RHDTNLMQATGNVERGPLDLVPMGSRTPSCPETYCPRRREQLVDVVPDWTEVSPPFDTGSRARPGPALPRGRSRGARSRLPPLARTGTGFGDGWRTRRLWEILGATCRVRTHQVRLRPRSPAPRAGATTPYDRIAPGRGGGVGPG